MNDDQDRTQARRQAEAEVAMAEQLQSAPFDGDVVAMILRLSIEPTDDGYDAQVYMRNRAADTVRDWLAGTGAGRIVAERVRQISSEGRTAAHDDQYWDGELLDTAVSYANAVCRRVEPGQEVRMLERAGALIAAEIDRRLRREKIIQAGKDAS